MQLIVLLMIVSVILANFFVRLDVLPQLAKFLPELLSAVAGLVVVAMGAIQRFQFVRLAYWLVFAVIAISVLCGIFANGVESGPVINGMRVYLRALPFFFLPAVVRFTDGQIRRQLWLVFLLALAQVPIAVFQRWVVQSEGRWTGDPVSGTLEISSILSIFLISTACVLTGLHLRGRISKLAYIALFFLLLFPTMINETKGTLFLLPPGLLLAFVFGSPPQKRIRITITAVVMLAGFAAVFFPVYQMMLVNRPYGVPLTDLFTQQGALEGKLMQSQQLGSYEDRAPPGRLDTVVVPLREISHDPVSLVFGLGIGSVRESSALGPQFTGAYYRRLEYFTFTSLGSFLSELGLLGTGLVFLLYWLIFQDSLAVARRDSSTTGAIAVGWCGVVGVVVLGCFYKQLEMFESLSYLFWYFSGLVAASRMRGAARDTEPARVRPSRASKAAIQSARPSAIGVK